MTNDASILRARELTKVYGSGHTAVHAVNSVSVDVRPGELVLIMGPSGSGKTTLLSMLGGLLRPTSGTVEIAQAELTTLGESRLPQIRARNVGFIFQAFNLLSALSVEENILFPARLTPQGVRPARARVAALIERLGLAHRRRALPRELSGGEKQRVAIARALVNQPPLILADEPTGNLDSQNGQQVMMILHDIARDEGRAVVMVTHDPRVEDVADRILWLEDGALRDRKRERHDWIRDPVCGMRVDRWTATMWAEFHDDRYAFCSQRCQSRFLTAPAEFVADVDATSAARARVVTGPARARAE